MTGLRARVWAQVHNCPYCAAVSIKSSPLTQFWIVPKGTVVSRPRLKCGWWNSMSWRLVPAGSRDEAISLCGGRVHSGLMPALSCLLCSEAESGSFPILFTRRKEESESSDFLNVSKRCHICCSGHLGRTHLLGSLRRLKRSLQSLKRQISLDKP